MNKVQLIQQYDKRNKQINFRLSSNEYKVLCQLCNDSDISVGEFVRRCINDYAEKHYEEYCNQIVDV